MAIAAPIFELTNVSHRFGSTAALHNISLRVEPGERVALLGASGAGKSTLIRLLNGTLLPTSGEISVLGQNLNHLKPRQLRRVQRQIGTIYQQFHLVDNLRVIHNVNAGNLGRWSFAKACLSLVYPAERDKAAAALTQVGIPEKLYARTDQLSGGQQQRVALARVLVQDPAVILADEPVASLDPERSREMMTLLKDLSTQKNHTLIVSLHTVELAQMFCQRLIGLRKGRILFDLPTGSVTSELFADLYRLESDERAMSF
ncbi:MAG TPA: phosphonate ABC transporter ATP-binding protein [Leptolyngbyaceae cyanobacterium M33_DOE_097]|uniref:Phosphonate ABC transporter ATP-binding protein n=1 Tax=Oscillatoriales cyanobacterium SpSt-418 TaxID=2282169 RepID=A0A7C3PUI2_9CYAN|nr:phosphonate ABC transporter ATP-binding protein [Leptolyngbyaceae cyanobacterium M33_DOE_097]